MDTRKAVDDSIEDIAADLPSGLLDTRTAAQALGVTPRCLQAWRERGGGPPYLRMHRDGGATRAVRYRPRALARWLAAREVRSTSDPGSAS